MAVPNIVLRKCCFFVASVREAPKICLILQIEKHVLELFIIAIWVSFFKITLAFNEINFCCAIPQLMPLFSFHSISTQFIARVRKNNFLFSESFSPLQLRAVFYGLINANVVFCVNCSLFRNLFQNAYAFFKLSIFSKNFNGRWKNRTKALMRSRWITFATGHVLLICVLVYKNNFEHKNKKSLKGQVFGSNFYENLVIINE